MTRRTDILPHMPAYPFTLGIIGGGQLGRMLALAARRMGLGVAAMDPDSTAPCRRVVDTFIEGRLDDAGAMRRLAASCDILTYEIEHIDVDALRDLEAGGARIQPSPAALEAIQDKLVQKMTLAAKGIPVADFAAHPSSGDFGFPVVEKARRGGYDGRGVAVRGSIADPGLDRPFFVERLIDIEAELAVLVAVGAGETTAYPVFEMTFREGLNICDRVIAPARVDESVAARAVEIAAAAAGCFHGWGVFAVELFLDRTGRLLVNEVAPRVHNSGHLTIEAGVTGQFEQHIRAVGGLPLGNSELRCPAVMVNLLGEAGKNADQGPPSIRGAEEALRIPGLSLHLYGKAESRPGRKMGHFTVCADTLEEALARAELARGLLHITPSQEAGRT